MNGKRIAKAPVVILAALWLAKKMLGDPPPRAKWNGFSHDGSVPEEYCKGQAAEDTGSWPYPPDMGGDPFGVTHNSGWAAHHITGMAAAAALSTGVNSHSEGNT